MAIALRGGGYSGFQVTGMIEWRQKSQPPKNSIGLPTKPIKIPGTKISPIPHPPSPRNPMPSFRALKIFRKQNKLDCTLFAELRGRIRGHYHESSDFSTPSKNLGIEKFQTQINPSIIPVT